MKSNLRKTISAVLCLAMVLGCVLCTPAGIAGAASASDVYTVTVTYHQSEARKMLSGINALRTGSEAWYLDSSNQKVYVSGLESLVYDYDLEKIAMQRAAEIVVYFDHVRPNGEDFITAYDDNYLSAGENIAYGYNSASSVQTAFEESDENYSGQGHRRNMLKSSYTAVGLACAEYNGVKFWVQEFRRPAGSTSYTAPNDSTADVNVEISSSMILSESLTVSPTVMTLTAGSSANLPEAYLNMKISGGRTLNIPADGAVWSSSNTSAASVSGNTVYGGGSGTAVLTVSYKGCTAGVTVTVSGSSSGGSTSGNEGGSTGDTGNTGGSGDNGTSGTSWLTSILNIFKIIVSAIKNVIKIVSSLF